jgi:excisionase family DNA binding protein
MNQISALQAEIAEAVRLVVREELRAALEAQKAPPSPYMDVAEAAQAFNVTERTVRRWIAEGKVESRRVGGKLLIPRETGR